MNSDRLNRWMSLGANVAVLAGDDEEFAKSIYTMRSVLSQSLWSVQHWRDTRQLYPSEFVAEIDDLLPADSSR